MKFGLRKRRAVFDAGIIILGVIVAIVAIIAATLAWSDILETTFVDLITEMPKFDYDVQDGQETGNMNFEIYEILRNIALLILVIVLFFAGLSFMFEQINVVPPETGFTIISKSVFFIFLFFFFPPLWDLIATLVEQMSFWILNPEDPTNVTGNVEVLLTKLGGIESPEFTLDGVVAGITDPFGALKDMFLGVFLAVFKAIALLIFIFTTFLLGTIRIVLTAILSIGLPIILMLSLIPFFKRVTDRFLDAFMGLMIAPIFSAIVLVSGVAYLSTLEDAGADPIQQWFAALAVMALTVFIPAMIVPMLGSILNAVQTAATGAVSAGAIMTGMAGMGAMRGMGGAMSGMSSQAAAMGNPLSSLQLARQAFLTRPGLAAMGKSAVMGAGSGIGSAASHVASMASHAAHGPKIMGMHKMGPGVGSSGSSHVSNGADSIQQIGIQAENTILANQAIDKIHHEVSDVSARSFIAPETTFLGSQISATPKTIDRVMNNAVSSNMINGLDDRNLGKIKTSIGQEIDNNPVATYDKYLEGKIFSSNIGNGDFE